MTTLECANTYGMKVTAASFGDNIIKLTRRIYRADSPNYRKVLMELNRRVDWYELNPGDYIFYIDPSLTHNIDSFFT
jgi:hypothetical protein